MNVFIGGVYDVVEMRCPLAVLTCNKPNCLTLRRIKELSKKEGDCQVESEKTGTSFHRKCFSSEHTKSEYNLRHRHKLLGSDEPVEVERCDDEVSSRSKKKKKEEQSASSCFECKCEYCCMILDALKDRPIKFKHGAAYFTSCLPHHMLKPEKLEDYFCRCQDCRDLLTALEGTSIVLKHGGGKLVASDVSCDETKKKIKVIAIIMYPLIFYYYLPFFPGC